MGGHAIKNAIPIKTKIAKHIATEVSNKLTEYFNVPTTILGSTMKKLDTDTCGDIDIAIQMEWNECNIQEVEHYGLSHLSTVDVVVSPGLHLISYGYKDNITNNIYQIDIMFTHDIEYSKFMYHSPNYISNESKFKGLYRTNLLILIASHIPLDINTYPTTYYTPDDFNGLYAGQIKEFYKYTLTYDNGLEIRKKTTTGKRRMCKKAYTLSKELVTNNINDIIHIVLGGNAAISDTNSYESLIAYMYSNKWPYSSDIRHDILLEFLNDTRHNKDNEIYVNLVKEIQKFDKMFIHNKTI